MGGLERQVETVGFETTKNTSVSVREKLLQPFFCLIYTWDNHLIFLSIFSPEITGQLRSDLL